MNTIDERDDLLYLAWTIIANANGGHWERADPDWVKAAIKWRDRFHASLPNSATPQEEPVR